MKVAELKRAIKESMESTEDARDFYESMQWIHDQLDKLEPPTMADLLAKRNQEDDLLILADAAIDSFRYDGSCEYGSVGTDCKRPFGNGNVNLDMAYLLGIVKDSEEHYRLSEEDSDTLNAYVQNLYMEELPKFFKRKWKEFRVAS